MQSAIRRVSRLSSFVFHNKSFYFVTQQQTEHVNSFFFEASRKFSHKSTSQIPNIIWRRDFKEFSFLRPMDGLSQGKCPSYLSRQKLCYTSEAEKESSEEDETTETISVTFVDKRGKEKLIRIPVGMSILEAALLHDLDMEGACEGTLSCSTCHVIVMDPKYYNRLPEPTDEENDMLDVTEGLTDTSRLGCQLIATPELDGIRLALPKTTGNYMLQRWAS